MTDKPSQVASKCPVLHLTLKNEDSHFDLKLSVGQYIMGRHPQSQLCVNHPSISQKHCQLIVKGANLIRLVDLGSKNGVFVNGNRLEKEESVDVRVGEDKLEIADLETEFRVVDKEVNAEKEEGKRKKQSKTDQNRNDRKNQDKKQEKQEQNKKAENPKRKEEKSKQPSDVEQEKDKQKKSRNKNKTGKDLDKRMQQEQSKINEQTRKLSQKQVRKKSQQQKVSQKDNKTKKVEKNEKKEQVLKPIMDDRKDQSDEESVLRDTKDQKKNKKVTYNQQEKGKFGINKEKPNIVKNDKPQSLPKSDFGSKAEKSVKPPSKTLLLHYSKNHPCIVVLSAVKDYPSLPKSIQIGQSHKDDFDVLVMPSFVRTVKLLYSICLGKPIVSTDWLIACSKAKEVLSYEGYEIDVDDEPGVLKESLSRARRGQKVFDGLEISLMCAPEKFHLGIQEIVDLVTAGGGSMLGYRRVDFPKAGLYLIAPRDHEDIAQQIKTRTKQGFNVNSIEMITRSCLYQSLRIKDTRIQF